MGSFKSKGAPSLDKGHTKSVIAIPGATSSVKVEKSNTKLLGPSKPVETSSFKSDNIPTLVVSQYISNNESTGSVS